MPICLHLCNEKKSSTPIISVRELSKMTTSLANISPEQINSLSNYPALQPPPGVVPNFVNPENQNRPLLVTASLELGLMIVFVLNRFYSKSFLVRKYSWDDCQSSLALSELESVANTSNSDSAACCCKY